MSIHIWTVAIAAALAPAATHASTINVSTAGSAAMIFLPVSKEVGPVPWSDVGVAASITMVPLPVVASVAGSTSYTLSSPGLAQAFVPGSTKLSVGYGSVWSGSVASSAFALVQGDMTFGIGPLHADLPLLTAKLNTATSGDPYAALQFGGTGIAKSPIASQNVKVTTGLSADVGPCPFCVTLASITAAVDLTAQLQQILTWKPTVTYGDLVWYSTTKTLTAADTPILVTGDTGSVDNLFGDPSATLALTNGETIYMNILPVVKLNMPITEQTIVSLPVDLSFHAEIFGATADKTFPLGNLFNVSTGKETLDLTGEWFGARAFSIALDVTQTCGALSCRDTYKTPGVNLSLGTIPNLLLTDLLPTDGTARNFDPLSDGPGTDPTRPLFPNGACSPDDPALCITSLTATVTDVPEPDSLMLFAAILIMAEGTRRFGSRRAGRGPGSRPATRHTPRRTPGRTPTGC